MSNSTEHVEPTDGERGYNKGWRGYHDGKAFNDNEFDPTKEQELHEGYSRGWLSAHREDISGG